MATLTDSSFSFTPYTPSLQWKYDKTKYYQHIVKGCLAGIELDEESPAGHDGRFGGTNYFECPEGHGIFVRLMDVVKIIKTAKDIAKEKASAERIETIGDIEISEDTISDALKVGDRVTLTNKKQGVIKYIGSTDFSEGKPMLGIELDEEDTKHGMAVWGVNSILRLTWVKLYLYAVRVWSQWGIRQ